MQPKGVDLVFEEGHRSQGGRKRLMWTGDSQIGP